MGDVWTRERVLGLAPDSASAKAGEGLSSPRKWVSSGRDDRVVWGECQGSGAKPYQVQVDLAGEVAFKCSCPSRKFPCKHGIGLMLVHAAGQIAAGGTRPAWVEAWIASRAERAAKKEEKAQQKAAEATPEKLAERAEAAAERRAKRLGTVVAGVADMRLWLEDLLRAGLAAAPSRGIPHFEERARRLVDAQAPGAARMVREIGVAAISGDGWQHRTLEAAARAHLLSEAAARLDTLPPDLREETIQTCGVPVPKETVEATAGIADEWLVLARDVELEENLRTQKTYIYGKNTGRPAVMLHFAYGRAPLDVSVPVGVVYACEMAFYPGRSLRAVVKGAGKIVAPISQVVGPASIAELLSRHAELLGERPWLDGVVLPVSGVFAARGNGKWWLVDASGDAIPLAGPASAVWSALAITGGEQTAMAVWTDGRTATVMAVMEGGVWHTVMQAREEMGDDEVPAEEAEEP